MTDIRPEIAERTVRASREDRDRSRLEGSIDNLDSALSQSHHLVARLGDRLAPVMREQQESMGDTLASPDRVEPSPIVRRIESAEGSLLLLNGYLADLLDRLEV